MFKLKFPRARTYELFRARSREQRSAPAQSACDAALRARHSAARSPRSSASTRRPGPSHEVGKMKDAFFSPSRSLGEGSPTATKTSAPARGRAASSFLIFVLGFVRHPHLQIQWIFVKSEFPTIPAEIRQNFGCFYRPCIYYFLFFLSIFCTSDFRQKFGKIQQH